MAPDVIIAIISIETSQSHLLMGPVYKALESVAHNRNIPWLNKGFHCMKTDKLSWDK